MKPALFIGFAALLLLSLLVFIGGAAAAEGALHPRRLAIPQNCPHAENVECRSVSLTSPDGTALSAWYFEPGKRSSAAILLLHGIRASRWDMIDLGRLFENAGYAARIPDLRGHGESGGLVTYGVAESQDIATWTAWMLAQNGVARIYGFGASLGASELLESLSRDHDFRAVVAESAYSDFPSIALERVARQS